MLWPGPLLSVEFLLAARWQRAAIALIAVPVALTESFYIVSTHAWASVRPPLDLACLSFFLLGVGSVLQALTDSRRESETR